MKLIGPGAGGASEEVSTRTLPLALGGDVRGNGG